jgi:hypothetical protein
MHEKDKLSGIVFSDSRRKCMLQSSTTYVPRNRLSINVLLSKMVVVIIHCIKVGLDDQIYLSSP